MAIDNSTKIFCLFHKKTDCPCISPVTDEKMLRYRLEASIRNHEYNNKFESDPAEKARREAEIEGWRERLVGL